VEDLVNSVKAQLYERISSPLLFSLVFSWVAWNYRLILIAISSMSPSDKFMAIELLPLTYDNPLFYKAVYWFLGPALTATLYIFLYPIPAKFVYKYTRNEQKKLKEIQQLIEDETPLTIAEARKLRTALRQLETEFEQMMESRDAEIARLKSELSALSPAAPAKRRSAPPQKVQLNLPIEEQEILQFVAERDEVNLDDILSASRFDKLQGQYHVDQLVSHRLISVGDGEFAHEMSVELTERGRAFLVEKRMANQNSQ
jgi:hypothetical protein